MKYLLPKLTALAVAANAEEAATLFRGSDHLINFMNESDSIQCVGPTKKLKTMSIQEACKDMGDKTEPYACSKGPQLCCTESGINPINYGGEYGTCERIDEVEEEYDEEEEFAYVNELDSINCIGPTRRLRTMDIEQACNELGEVGPYSEPYVCSRSHNGARELCCTKSSLNPVQLPKGYGTCVRAEGGEHRDMAVE